ncbi:hypothetical protein P170DRAFT_466089 [Aspergillus steynii IBT 23096]|uniref:G domain-containing protein n=1 Tax=Aspergillus steynii IBT 23096 TaxID=1392250 RepID=A0A2I2G1A0_9EURO|nr:uncharacterized protein P170DRAFT_466089 [Aspergillus steynii IBT 23096]PLB46650.1 hypothetical protein P170DRAFT_466089 [Aspergillus steynii IBT 23096]
MASNAGHESEAPSFVGEGIVALSDEDEKVESETSEDEVEYGKVGEGSAQGDEKSKRSAWRVYTYETLRSLVTEAKGAASRPVLRFIRRHLAGTKLILVSGVAGAGKTTILQELSGLDLNVGHSLRSGTLQYYVCPALIDNEQYLFVDTAGFGASDVKDIPNMRDIVSCLSTLGPFVRVAGFIYVYGKMNPRLTEEDAKIMQWVQCFCGPQFYKNITIVTTQWDSWSKKSFKEAWKRGKQLERETEIARILNPPYRLHGGFLYHHGVLNDDVSAIDVDRHVLDNEDQLLEREAQIKRLITDRYGACETPKLQILSELAEGKSVEETEAAKVLIAAPGTTDIKTINDRNIVCGRPDDSDTGSNPLAIPKLLPPPGGRKPQNEKKGWFDSVFDWLDVAKHIALFFMKARQTPTSPKPEKRKASTWSFLDSVKNWWSGAPPEND